MTGFFGLLDITVQLSSSAFTLDVGSGSPQSTSGAGADQESTSGAFTTPFPVCFPHTAPPLVASLTLSLERAHAGDCVGVGAPTEALRLGYSAGVLDDCFTAAGGVEAHDFLLCGTGCKPLAGGPMTVVCAGGLFP